MPHVLVHERLGIALEALGMLDLEKLERLDALEAACRLDKIQYPITAPFEALRSQGLVRIAVGVSDGSTIGLWYLTNTGVEELKKLYSYAVSLTRKSG